MPIEHPRRIASEIGVQPFRLFGDAIDGFFDRGVKSRQFFRHGIRRHGSIGDAVIRGFENHRLPDGHARCNRNAAKNIHPFTLSTRDVCASGDRVGRTGRHSIRRARQTGRFDAWPSMDSSVGRLR